MAVCDEATIITPKPQTRRQAVCLSIFGTVLLLLSMIPVGRLLFASGANVTTAIHTGDNALMDSYDMYINNQISDALEGVLKIDKIYWLNDSDAYAPKPDPAKFGTTDDPASLQWLLDAAEPLIDGQELLFSVDTELYPDSEVVYYLDETIFCISWKRQIGNDLYTMSEVFIAHPSQFRRYLADDTFGSGRRYHGSEMASAVNAVSASNGDFYHYRMDGVVVYKGEVCRANPNVDICFVDDLGELLLVRKGELADEKAISDYVKENNVRFSLAFGPILLEDGQIVSHKEYPLGNIDGHYPRAAIATLGKLHYLQVVAGYTPKYQPAPTIVEFAQILQSFGCEDAYALDGGQTGLVVVNGNVRNFLSYGAERYVSDILYFATAIPDGG